MFFSEGTCKFILYISLIEESFGAVILFLTIRFDVFEFSVIDNEFYLLLMFDGEEYWLT